MKDEDTDVTDIQDPAAISEALALIDQGLGDLRERSIVPTNEMSNLLLDVRLLLSSIEFETKLEDTIV